MRAAQQTPVASQATVAPRVWLEREEEQGVGVEPKDLVTFSPADGRNDALLGRLRVSS